jgi:hypothetical protein
LEIVVKRVITYAGGHNLKENNKPKGLDDSNMLVVSRRQVMAGLTAAAIVGAAPIAAAKQLQTRKSSGRSRSNLVAGRAVPRNMGAASILLDGRVLVTGGYGSLPSEFETPSAMSSAAIYDPYQDRWYTAPSMTFARARHAMVTLSDGRVAVIGGMGFQALASIEIYDPVSNSWSSGGTLSQPRYDHAAVANGDQIIVLGGTSQSIVPGVEVIETRHESTY